MLYIVRPQLTIYGGMGAQKWPKIPHTLAAIIGMLVHIIIVNIFGNIREQLLAYFIRRLIKYNDINLHLVFEKKIADNLGSNF